LVKNRKNVPQSTPLRDPAWYSTTTSSPLADTSLQHRIVADLSEWGKRPACHTFFLDKRKLEAYATISANPKIQR
jgi:hypothetical protein